MIWINKRYSGYLPFHRYLNIVWRYFYAPEIEDHLNIPCDKTFPWVTLFFTLWSWSWSLTHFLLLKTLTLLITFLNETWALIELWYFTWILIFLVIRPFLGYHYFFDTVTLTLGLSDISENFNLADNIWTVSSRALIFHMSIPCDKTFQWFH